MYWFHRDLRFPPRRLCNVRQESSCIDSFVCGFIDVIYVYNIAKRRQIWLVPRNVTMAKLDTRRTKLYSVRDTLLRRVGTPVAEELAWIPAKSFHLFRVDRTLCRFPLASSPSARRGNPAWPQHKNIGKCDSECSGFTTRDWTENGLWGLVLWRLNSAHCVAAGGPEVSSHLLIDDGSTTQVISYDDD